VPPHPAPPPAHCGRSPAPRTGREHDREGAPPRAVTAQTAPRSAGGGHRRGGHGRWAWGKHSGSSSGGRIVLLCQHP